MQQSSYKSCYTLLKYIAKSYLDPPNQSITFCTYLLSQILVLINCVAIMASICLDLNINHYPSDVDQMRNAFVTWQVFQKNHAWNRRNLGIICDFLNPRSLQYLSIDFEAGTLPLYLITECFDCQICNFHHLLLGHQGLNGSCMFPPCLNVDHAIVAFVTNQVT